MPAGDAWGGDAQIVRSMWEMGKLDKQIASVIGRSAHAIKKYRLTQGWTRPAGRPPLDRDKVLGLPEPVEDEGHVLAILAHGGFTRALLRERAAAELRRRGIAA